MNTSLKTNDGIIGYKKLPKWLRLSFRRGVKGICQICKKHESEVGKLVIHRVLRGHKGGLYTVWPLDRKGSNCKAICKGCHRKVHAGEFK